MGLLATVCVGKGTLPGGTCLQPGSLRCDAHCLTRTVTNFSVQSSDGFVLNELPFFAEGMTSLAPGAKIGRYRDTLDNLLPLIKEGKIASDITVTVRYRD